MARKRSASAVVDVDADGDAAGAAAATSSSSSSSSTVHPSRQSPLKPPRRAHPDDAPNGGHAAEHGAALNGWHDGADDDDLGYGDEADDDGGAGPIITSVVGFNVVKGEEYYLVEWGRTGRCTWEPYVHVHSSRLVRAYRRRLVGRGFEEQHREERAVQHVTRSSLPSWTRKLPQNVKLEVRRDEQGEIEGAESLSLMVDYVRECTLSREAVAKLREGLVPRETMCGCKKGESIAYDGRRALRENYEHDYVFECTSECDCPASCPSRVVQRGQATKVELYYTRRCGWGVRAAQDIARGAYVVEYTGEIVTNAEANTRGLNDPSRTYLFDLDASGAADLVIDATRIGNYSRFFNHSCEPNLRALTVFTTEPDGRLQHIAFFASRDIAKGEELTFDYKPLQEKFAPSINTIWLRCMCDKPGCRKFLFFY